MTDYVPWSWDRCRECFENTVKTMPAENYRPAAFLYARRFGITTEELDRWRKQGIPEKDPRPPGPRADPPPPVPIRADPPPPPPPRPASPPPRTPDPPPAQDAQQQATAEVIDMDKKRQEKAEREAKKKSEREQAQVRAVGLAKRYVYVVDLDRWYDTVADLFLSKAAVDAKHRAEFPYTKLTDALLTGGAAVIVDTVGWHPGGPPIIREAQRSLINAWIDDGLPGKTGDIRPWVEHAEYLVPDRREREHLFDWLAFVLQQPAVKCNHQLVLGGRPGIGKDALIAPVIAGVGRSNVSQVQADELQQPFNNYIDRKKLVVFQEIFTFQRKDIENRIKPLACAPPDTIRINNKGISQYSIPNLVALIFMTNHYADAMNISPDDRRYFCVWCPAPPMPPAYYLEFYRYLAGGGSAAVVAWLRERNLSGFMAGGNAPTTPWKLILQSASAQGVESILREAIEEEHEPFDRDLLTVAEIAAKWPALAAKRGVLPAALANIGAVHRKVKFRPPVSLVPDGKSRTRGIWILRNHEDHETRSDHELGCLWIQLGGDLAPGSGR